MQKIIYNPLTMIMLNLAPTTALIGNWTEWSNIEDEIIKLGLQTDQDLTIVNIVEDDHLKVICEHAIDFQARENHLKNVITFIIPKCTPKEFYNFESFKSMFHFKKIIINAGHKFLQPIKTVMGDEQIQVVNALKNDDNLFFKAQKALINGDLKLYKTLAGANYNFSGIVVHGQQVGRMINFPTANMQKGELPFKQGVYLAKINLPNDETTYWGMADYWNHPVKGLTFEVHIFDFDQDIYGWNIKIELIEFERENVKINNLEELKILLTLDKKNLIKKIN
ncbi:riboflavin kinase [Williamsoniiplasma lucivorax]|uniref:riboflavin kinase n=1 Tax=Williamsoniiplasma lucivorax TaxID=209274 RepID=A0A2S5RCV7_9MOLU|nr:riboflavin kinase [Williamsoniiplasma lucivorax]PPE05154.1 riboflavin kinase/FAD synthetase [Williamsoniiplasma lucivorax]